MTTLWGQSEELEAGHRTCLRNVRGLWKDHSCSSSSPKAKGAGNVKRGEGGQAAAAPLHLLPPA